MWTLQRHLWVYKERGRKSRIAFSPTHQRDISSCLTRVVGLRRHRRRSRTLSVSGYRSIDITNERQWPPEVSCDRLVEFVWTRSIFGDSAWHLCRWNSLVRSTDAETRYRRRAAPALLPPSPPPPPSLPSFGLLPVLRFDLTKHSRVIRRIDHESGRNVRFRGIDLTRAIRLPKIHGNLGFFLLSFIFIEKNRQRIQSILVSLAMPKTNCDIVFKKIWVINLDFKSEYAWLTLGIASSIIKPSFSVWFSFLNGLRICLKIYKNRGSLKVKVV